MGKMLSAVAFSFGVGASSKRAERGGNNKKDPLADALALELSSESMRWPTFCIVFVIMYIPTIVAMLIVFTVVDPYKSPSCTGCDVFVEELICILFLYLVILLARWRLAALLKDEPDPDGIIPEMKLAGLALLPPMLVGIVLLIVDPGLLDFHMVISYEWLLALGLLNVYIVSVPYQLFLAYKEHVAREAFQRSKTHVQVDPEVALKDSAVFHRFEAFAEANFCSESVAFLSDAWGWKAQCAKRPPEWKLLKARALVNMYVLEASLLQINISSTMRDAIEKEVALGGDLRDTLFDDALEEVLKMLKWNLW